MPSSRPNPFAVLTSLRLTVVLLVLSIVLVFAATLDQVHLGVWGVQEKYFRSFFIYSQIPGTALFFPVFPGGYLLGGVLIVNLVAAHFYRFRYSWKKSGIWLTHAGLILLLVGAVPTWGHSRSWGYGPSGLLGLVLVIVLILLLLGYIPRGF